ncbi:MAG: hypothetical protein KKF16_08160 [Euryarchaeota archaeon]|nr:hypothetical protein [Euryarchaeota archaeon]MBV1729419.1 hypothetical protein [Methanobacterium sp.]MBU4548139.1 hypothetical protein [Euryarchaeota archaeon]MBU4606966.1 hypothetical protein [Euryarchaeota archaeon]MBV1754644.1 hypothetical protein [Methanobacterium sp.]
MQADENPEDFESCQCNGKLIFRDDISENNFQETKSSPKADKTIIYKDQYYTEKMANKYHVLSIFGKFLLIIGAVVFIFSFNSLAILTCFVGFFLFIQGSEKIKTWKKGASGEKKDIYLSSGYPQRILCIH